LKTPFFGGDTVYPTFSSRRTQWFVQTLVTQFRNGTDLLLLPRIDSAFGHDDDDDDNDDNEQTMFDELIWKQTIEKELAKVGPLVCSA
jgi:hypothetical protein